MKIIGAILILFSFTLSGNAQEAKEKEVKAKDVPSAVLNAFKAKYPQSQAKKWVKEESNFETEFTLKGQEYEAAFDASGTWKETEREIKTTTLPKPIKDELASSKYKDWSIKEAVEVESPEYKLAYELELVKGKEKVELYFTPDGKLVKEEKN